GKVVRLNRLTLIATHDIASMTSTSQGFNSSPTKSGIERLRYFIKGRERELKFVKEETMDQMKQLEACDNAQIQAKALRNESVTKALCTELLNHPKKSLSQFSQNIDEQIAVLRVDVRVLWDKLRELEMELGSWRTTQRLLQKAMMRLNASQLDIEVDIKTGKEAFRPLWNVPSEVWAKIFEYAIEGAKNGYLKENQSNYGMRPPIFNLSQVCQRWRYLVNSESKLWTLSYVAPTQMWRQDEHDLIATSVKKSNVPMTIITNLSQYFYSGYDRYYRFDIHGDMVATVSPDESSLFNGKEYILLVDMYEDDLVTMSRLSNLPLRQPTSLIFSGRSSIQRGYLFEFISNFSGVKSLSLFNDNPLHFPDVTLSSYFPQLHELRIEVGAFPSSLSLNSYLPATLHELRLRNNTGDMLPILSSEIELPHLRILEITSPGAYLLDMLTARGLQSLKLYRPRIYRAIQISSSTKATEIYGNLLHLKFEDWKSRGSLGAVAVFRNLIQKVPSLHTLAFFRSFVDGNMLLSATRMPVGGNGDAERHIVLTEITLSHPRGITNDQCEELRQLVNTVKLGIECAWGLRPGRGQGKVVRLTRLTLVITHDITIIQGFNNSPTKRETERLRCFIKSRETELTSVKKELLEETKQLGTCDKAISNLELTIPEAKQILKANEDNLASLISIQTQLSTVGRIQEKALKNEPVTKTLYSEFRSYSKKPHERLSEHIDEQILALKRDVRVLWDKVRELEMELGGWKASKRLFQRAITRLNTSYSDIETDIKTGNEAFRPIWSIPSDVWVKILKYTIEEEKASYLVNQENIGMRPPVIKLSQVCQQWRYLVNSEPALRTLVYVAPSQ
ncbi:17604_t:CDS:2, partial [Acaulospora colombiana]